MKYSRNWKQNKKITSQIILLLKPDLVKPITLIELAETSKNIIRKLFNIIQETNALIPVNFAGKPGGE